MWTIRSKGRRECTREIQNHQDQKEGGTKREPQDTRHGRRRTSGTPRTRMLVKRGGRISLGMLGEEWLGDTIISLILAFRDRWPGCHSVLGETGGLPVSPHLGRYTPASCEPRRTTKNKHHTSLERGRKTTGRSEKKRTFCRIWRSEEQGIDKQTSSRARTVSG
jgi:hypothetical protein